MSSIHEVPRSYFNTLNVGEIKPKGWILQQMEQDLGEGIAGHLPQLTSSINPKIFKEERVDSFEVTPSGMVQDTPRTWWSGEQTAFWMDGYVRMAYLTGSEKDIRIADNYMKEILHTQDEDGYIGIYTNLTRFKHKKENGEFWTQSRIFMVMLAYYELTGKTEYLDAVVKAMRLTMQYYGPDNKNSYFNNEEPAGGTGHGLMLVEVLEWLYRITGEEDFLTFGLWCYEDYCSAKKIRDTDNQLDNLLDLEKPFMWHAPHTTEHLKIPIWLYYATGDPLLKEAGENAYTKIKRYLVPSGACIGDENIIGRDPDPSLPYEYCGITELMISLYAALQKTGNTEWGERIERLAFNAAQGARLPDGKAISYLSKDNRASATTEETSSGNPKEKLAKFQYSPTHEKGALCCAGNSVKLMPYYVNQMWMRVGEGEKAGLAMVSYGPSCISTIVQNVTIEIESITSYPFDESFLFHIRPAQDLICPLYFRIPAWSTAYEVHCEEAKITEQDGYLVVVKSWKSDDQIRLLFQTDIISTYAANGEAALNRGPLLYALPISEQRITTHSYEGTDFVDFDAIPIHENPGHMDWMLDGTKKNFGFTFENISLITRWEKPSNQLNGQLLDQDGVSHPVTLVPIGATVLRKVTFPIFIRQ
ncbi:beta-L-arabinofuranosidase domain-containing protein [Paenibacillus sp. NPDC058071]|uniref:beta-L-arabinofuranosidase domain-containing protein n=1 Tax=Paenibacillus sp. NPDC058071 TaxID=3346326 RepID=UPI0036DF4C39